MALVDYDKGRQDWRFRAVEHTRGNQTQLGTILLAVLDKPAKNPPWYGRTAVIEKDGSVLSNFYSSRGTFHEQMRVCSVIELRDMFRRLADDLKLNDVDRTALFLRVRDWIKRDDTQEKEIFPTKL